ncbi:hypothetical protein CBR_g4309 [Chara braunii]|uniref:Uncharacterized protein n=1 Tax=Chara braunii TaxID=69332 RepID=A0A388JRM1_CHABU|nr:hypothetical protein CBR_g4309 [Chara braunii]|eukprot:GBG60352.1 hypothetical protein CBR_g4309 [Chara braunii]
MLGDISTFTAPATISEQLDTLKTEVRQLQQLPDKDGNTSAQQYKMPTFRIEKFDDYTHQDPVPRWQGFMTELRIPHIPEHSYIRVLFLNSKGGCQIWLSHLATTHGVQVADLHKEISWEDQTRQWKKRSIVDDAAALAINRLFSMTQGNTPTRDWLTKWQKIVATPDLDLPFPHLHREFYNVLCVALSLPLGDRELYITFVEIINKAREIIKTNRTVAHEKYASDLLPDSKNSGVTYPDMQRLLQLRDDCLSAHGRGTTAYGTRKEPQRRLKASRSMAWKKLILVEPMEVNAWTADSNGLIEMCGVIPEINGGYTSGNSGWGILGKEERANALPRPGYRARDG